MKAIVVYESMFGNTERVASAVAEGLRRSMQVDVVEVGAAAGVDVERADLLVLGAPTQAHGLSRPGTRSNGARQTTQGPASGGTGIREWLETLPSTASVACAAFDTRFDKPRWLTGSAAKGIESRLRAKGYRPVAVAESFFVEGTSGPLKHGEPARAAAWGLKLASAISAGAAAGTMTLERSLAGSVTRRR
jgi:hypothetical protein